MKIYYDADANMEMLKEKVLGIIGYGSQGHAQAQNLRDSGCDVRISEVKGTKNFELAKEHGFDPVAAAELTRIADFIHILAADEAQPDIYQKEIAPGIEEGKTLVFSHGFNIHYNQIVPPPQIDVIMIAPKGPGHLVRRQYVNESGVPALIAVYQDASGSAREKALAYARGIGATRAGVIETTFREETETDLFGEQVALCGGLTSLIMASFETLVEAGYSPEIAYFECCHEMKLIVDLIHEGGISRMRDSISNTAQYGDITRGPRVIDDRVKEEMRNILEEVRSGEFAREWILENRANRPVFNALTRAGEGHLVERVGKKLREMMPWLK